MHVLGLSNEILIGGICQELLENHHALNEAGAQARPTRPTTDGERLYAGDHRPHSGNSRCEQLQPLFWLVRRLDQNDDFFDTYHAKYPTAASAFSEYGADANPAYQSAHPEKGDYTEDLPVRLSRAYGKDDRDRPWLWATHVWNMFDFAADGRDEGGKNGENQKGLVTFDRKIKKDAFYLYKAYGASSPLYTSAAAAMWTAPRM